jgi:hypothetical protein
MNSLNRRNRIGTGVGLIFLDGTKNRPEESGEAVIGNFHKERTGVGCQSPLRLLAISNAELLSHTDGAS